MCANNSGWVSIVRSIFSPLLNVVILIRNQRTKSSPSISHCLAPSQSGECSFDAEAELMTSTSALVHTCVYAKVVLAIPSWWASSDDTCDPFWFWNTTTYNPPRTACPPVNLLAGSSRQVMRMRCCLVKGPGMEGRHFGAEQRLSVVHGCVTPMKINIEKQTCLLFLLWVLCFGVTWPRYGWPLTLLGELDMWLSEAWYWDSTVYLCAPSKTWGRLLCVGVVDHKGRTGTLGALREPASSCNYLVIICLQAP